MRHKWRGPQTKLHHGCPCRLLSTERGPLLEATIATHSTVAQQSQRSCPYGCQCRQPDAQKTFFQLGPHTNLPDVSSASTVQLIPRVGPLQTQEGHDTCQSPSDWDVGASGMPVPGSPHCVDSRILLHLLVSWPPALQLLTLMSQACLRF